MQKTSGALLLLPIAALLASAEVSAKPINTQVQELGITLHFNDDRFGESLVLIKDPTHEQVDYSEIVREVNDRIRTHSFRCHDEGGLDRALEKVVGCDHTGFIPTEAAVVPGNKIDPTNNDDLILVVKGKTGVIKGETYTQRVWYPLESEVKRIREGKKPTFTQALQLLNKHVLNPEGRNQLYGGFELEKAFQGSQPPSRPEMCVEEPTENANSIPWTPSQSGSAAPRR